MSELYSRKYGEKIIQTARIKLLGIGKWTFETSLFGEKQFETNMNMPMFNTEEEAIKWIEESHNWGVA